jgi:hypothetical protein
MKNKVLKNKKAQGEVILDAFAFIFIIILCVAVLSLSITSRLFQDPNNSVVEKGKISNMQDRITVYVISKLKEKQDTTTFANLLRSGDAAKQELTTDIQKICQEHKETCSVVMDNSPKDCWQEAIAPDSSKVTNLCFIVPGDKPLFIKIYNRGDAGWSA